MMSKAPGENIEVRHFMDDEHQISIGLEKELWPILQAMANYSRAGSDWNNLNGWILRRLARQPNDVEAWEWIKMAVTG